MPHKLVIVEKFETYLRYEVNRSPHTVEAYLREVKNFQEFITSGNILDFKPEAIDPTDIRRWLLHLANSGMAPRSLRRKTQSLRAYFRFLCRREGLKNNPAEDIILAKIPKPLPDFVRDSDMKELLEFPDSETTDKTDIIPQNILQQRDRLILHILYATGLRRAELLSLNDASFSASSAILRVIGKGNKERIVPLAPELIDEIQEWQSIRDSYFSNLPSPKPIIATRNGYMSPSNLELIIKRLLREKPAGRKSPHSLRHSFATSMINGGANLNAVKAILGHSSLATTQIYTHLQFSDLRECYSNAHPRSSQNINLSGEKSESDKKQ